MTIKNVLTIFSLLIITTFCFKCVENNVPGSSLRQKEKFDFDWRFSKGEFTFYAESKGLVGANVLVKVQG